MQYCMNHPEEISKLTKLKAQITEVKGIMMDNIEKVTFSFLEDWFRKQKYLHAMKQMKACPYHFGYHIDFNHAICFLF